MYHDAPGSEVPIKPDPWTSLTHSTLPPDLAPVDSCLVSPSSSHFFLSCGDQSILARHALVDIIIPGTTRRLVVYV